MKHPILSADHNDSNASVQVFSHVYAVAVKDAVYTLLKDGKPCMCPMAPPLVIQNPNRLTTSLPEMKRGIVCNTECPKANLLKNILMTQHPQFNTEVSSERFEEILKDEPLLYQVSCMGEMIELPISEIVGNEPAKPKLSIAE